MVQRLRPIVWAGLFTLYLLFPDSLQGQSAGQWGICEFSTLIQLNAFSPGADDWACKIAYVNATHDHYEWDGSNWNQISTLNIYEANSSLTADRTLSLGDYSLTFSGLQDIHLSPDGYVGIGTATPASSLEVIGKTSTTNLQIIQGASRGYLLQSDASGNATWVSQTPFTNTDEQTLSLSGNTVSISDGNSIDLSSLSGFGDDLGDHTATENFQSGDYWLSSDGGNEGIKIASTGHIGINTTPLSDARITAAGANDIPGLYLTGEDNIWFDEGQVRITTHDGYGNWQIKSGVDNDDKYIGAANGAVKLRIDEAGTLGLYTAPSGTAGNSVSWNYGMVIKNSGRIDLMKGVRITGLSTGSTSDKLLVQNTSGDVYTLSSQTLVEAYSSDDQNLTLSSHSLSIEDGNSVDLSGYLDNTDAQDLSLSGNTLSLSGDASAVSLSSYLDDTDDQTLSLSGNTLSIADGNSVDLSGLTGPGDDLGNHTATENLQLGGFWVSNDGGDEGIFIEADGDVGIGTATPDQDFDVNGNIELDDRLYMNGKEVLRSTDDNWLRINTNGDYNNGTLTSAYLRVDNRMTVNEGGSNFDFRVEGENVTHLLFTDASADEVGIGTSSPDARLDVEGGSVRFSDYGAGDESGTPTYQLAVDADGDIIEVNTATSSRIFYPPALALDASSTGTDLTLDLHQEYQDRFGSPSVASSGAPSAIPSYGETELYYYVTDYDSAVLANISIAATGVMTYDVIATPASSCTILNVVFVVK